jgi:hypothetical protein
MNPNTPRNKLKTAGEYVLRRESTLVVMEITLGSWDPAVNNVGFRCTVEGSMMCSCELNPVGGASEIHGAIERCLTALAALQRRLTNPGQPKSVKLDRVQGDPAQTLGQSNSLAV